MNTVRILGRPKVHNLGLGGIASCMAQGEMRGASGPVTCETCKLVLALATGDYRAAQAAAHGSQDRRIAVLSHMLFNVVWND